MKDFIATEPGQLSVVAGEEIWVVPTFASKTRLPVGWMEGSRFQRHVARPDARNQGLVSVFGVKMTRSFT